MKRIEVYDWALKGIISRMQERDVTDHEKHVLNVKLKEVAKLYVIEKSKEKF